MITWVAYLLHLCNTKSNKILPTDPYFTPKKKQVIGVIPTKMHRDIRVPTKKLQKIPDFSLASKEISLTILSATNYRSNCRSISHVHTRILEKFQISSEIAIPNVICLVFYSDNITLANNKTYIVLQRHMCTLTMLTTLTFL